MRLFFDIETNPIDFSLGTTVQQAHTILCICAKDIDTNETFTWTEGGSIDFLKRADELIGHNVIEFDLPVLRERLGFHPRAKITDTLVLSRLAYPDREGGHGLAAWGGRLGYAKSQYDDFNTVTPELITYCQRDVDLTEKVYSVVSSELQDETWEEAIRLEHDIARIIAAQAEYGIYFDVPRGRELLSSIDEQINDISNSILSTSLLRPEPVGTVARPFTASGKLAKRSVTLADTYGIRLCDIAGPFSIANYVPINLDSDKQLKEFLLEKGWQPEETTPTGGPKLTTESLEKFTPIGPLICKRQQLAHRRGQLEGLLNLVRSDGRISAGANPCGTNTGRMKHKRVVNIPKVKVFLGKEFRSLFIASPGKILVGYDAKQLELRILAHYIGDENYANKIINGTKDDDVHTLAAQAGGLSDRDVGKTINYALIYGARDTRLGSIVGGDKRDGANLRARLYEKIPGLKTLVNNVEAAAKRGYLLGLDGRRLYVRSGKSPLNTLIQGGGAVCMKWIAARLDTLCSGDGLDGYKVLDMHDEAQWEIDPCEEMVFEENVHDAFDACTQHFKLKCRLEADVKRGQTWADTH